MAQTAIIFMVGAAGALALASAVKGAVVNKGNQTAQTIQSAQ